MVLCMKPLRVGLLLASEGLIWSEVGNSFMNEAGADVPRSGCPCALWRESRARPFPLNEAASLENVGWRVGQCVVLKKRTRVILF